MLNIYKIIDYYYSNPFLIVASFILIYSFFGLIAFRKPFKKEKSNQIYKVILLIIPNLIFIFIGGNCNRFGYVNYVKTISENSGFITIVNEKQLDDYNSYRLYVLDPKNGEVVNRSYFSGYDFELLQQKENAIFIKNRDNFYLMDIISGKIIKSYEPKTISKEYPSIPYGVESVTFSKNKLLEISAKDGNLYYIEPFSRNLYYKEPLEEKENNSNYFNYNSMKYQIDNDIYNYRLESKPGTHKIEILEPYENKKNNFIYPEFIEPLILQVFPKLQRIVILSYETTDKKDFILSCYDFNLKFIWNIKQQDEIKKNPNVKNSLFNTSSIEKDNLIFNSGGFIYSIKALDGNINWVVRL